MSARRFLDTNILLYSISREPAEADKRARALDLIDEGDCGLSVQVLQEFYVQATRPTRRDPLRHETAAGLIETWMRFPVQDNTVAILRDALMIRARHRFSYWDSAIVAAAKSLGCRELMSEDLSDGQLIEGITLVNPFK